MSDKKYQTFKEFYPFYLSQHKNKTCRLLHIIGTSIIVAILAYALISQHYILLWLMPLVGYGFAWIGHFFFEKNRPATFTYPLYSLIGDWVMWWQTITFSIKK
jgi:hypothetical protein